MVYCWFLPTTEYRVKSWPDFHHGQTHGNHCWPHFQGQTLDLEGKIPWISHRVSIFFSISSLRLRSRRSRLFTRPPPLGPTSRASIQFILGRIREAFWRAKKRCEHAPCKRTCWWEILGKCEGKHYQWRFIGVIGTPYAPCMEYLATVALKTTQI